MDNEINSYDYKPDFYFFSTGREKEEEKKLYVGYELEAENYEGNIDAEELACKITEIINDTSKQFVYYKHDGSLDCGIEVVSMPFTFDYIMEKESKIKEMLELMQGCGYKSHDTSTCGLHFHINREYFGDTEEEINNNIDKMILFIEYYKSRMINLSRRRSFGYCHFLSDCKDITNDDKVNILKIKKQKYNVDRYSAVNIRNSDTVEIRLMRGTLNYKTFMAMIEFVFSLAKVIKNNKITEISWDDVIYYGGNEYLPAYCSERKIEPSSEKMKDYSISYIRQQNKLRKQMENLLIEIRKELYDVLKKMTEKINLEYKKFLKTMPNEYSNRFNKEKMFSKYMLMENYSSMNSRLIRLILQQSVSDVIYYYNNFISDVKSYEGYKKLLGKENEEKIKEIDEKIKELNMISRKVDD